MTPDRHTSEDALVRAHLHLANQAVGELARRLQQAGEELTGRLSRVPTPAEPRPEGRLAKRRAACSDFRARLDAAPRPLLERAAEAGVPAPAPA
jgi:hypothetical protein